MRRLIVVLFVLAGCRDTAAPKPEPTCLEWGWGNIQTPVGPLSYPVCVRRG